MMVRQVIYAHMMNDGWMITLRYAARRVMINTGAQRLFKNLQNAIQSNGKFNHFCHVNLCMRYYS